MQEILEAAERQAKEEKWQRRRRDASPRGPEPKSAGDEVSRSAMSQRVGKQTKESYNRRELGATTDSQ
jgi:hypothetical protein